MNNHSKERKGGEVDKTLGFVYTTLYSEYIRKQDIVNRACRAYRTATSENIVPCN